MGTSLQTPIKELIGRYPKVGNILDEYGIGCVPCSVGTCALGDILEIHNLSPENEEILMIRIAAVVSPGKPIERPARKRGSDARQGKIAYSPPMKLLVDEHVLIKKFIGLVPALVEATDIASESGRERIIACVDFIRSYADRFHHAKEEDILFARFDQGLDILKVMHEDHRRGRACVREVFEALERGDGEKVADGFHRYSEVLTEHIKKEDGILYPWMDRILSTREVGELYSRFREVDANFEESGKRYESFVIDLENTLGARSAEVAR
ncbi:MAG: hemerythrin domain-containing protein [Deltaproteobacteria bacterium]|nr:hemerythrin domain-containing protein [Deltaproteobacteria bacterium]